MATRIEQLQILSNAAFQAQVASCFLFAAINVLAESASTPNHANRLQWAAAVVANPANQSAINLTYLLTNATLAAGAGGPILASGTPFTDSDIDFTVASLFDQLANKFAGQ